MVRFEGSHGQPGRTSRPAPFWDVWPGGLLCPWTRGTVDALACREAAGGKPRSERSRPIWMELPAVAGSGAELVWGRGLRLAVGHATTVRPDPSTLGVVGDRGSRREGCSRTSQAQPVSLSTS